MKSPLKSVRRALAVLCFLSPATLFADVKMPAIFGDNMVLQTSAKTPLWGSADPSEKITITAGDQKAEAAANADGSWTTAIDLSHAGDKPFEVTVSGKNTLAFKNVIAGEVWVCSGQSNMEFSLRGAKNSAEEINNANYPLLRHFTVTKAVSAKPTKALTGKWEVCTPEVAGHFTAVGYFFGRELNQQLKLPIGLIHTSWGGTPAEAWTSQQGLESSPDLQVFIDRQHEAETGGDAAKQKYDEQVKAWQAAGSPKDKKPRQPMLATGANNPMNLYNGMIEPIIPYGIKGVIWYQGESNAGSAYLYRTLFPAMIQDWRKHWGQGDFPFLFVQLANFQPRQPNPSDSAWAELREAQTMTLKLPHTGMATIIDIGEGADIHPKNKQDVGKRLALSALKTVYGKDVEDSGPMYDSMSIDANKVRLKFTHIGGGLVAKGEKLTGFAIAGEDKKWVWADAKIDGDTVVVSSPEVEKPVAVRYAWANNPDCNLYNKADLPAVPFRTDDWPGVTKK